jgi:hypothetical protein
VTAPAGHLWPPPTTDGIYRARRVYDDHRWSCFHAAVVGSGWAWEGPCRSTVRACERDLMAELDLRRWLTERAA